MFVVYIFRGKHFCKWQRIAKGFLWPKNIQKVKESLGYFYYSFTFNDKQILSNSGVNNEI